MTGFDPVTFGAVKKLSREIGELVLVPNNFKSDKYLETGQTIDAGTYPKLAAALGDTGNISSLSRVNLPQVSTPSFGISQLPTTFNDTYMEAVYNGYSYMLDTFGRISRVSTNGTTWEYVTTIPDYVPSLTATFLYFNNKFYVLDSTIAYQSSDACATWQLVTDFPLTTNRAKVVNGLLFLFNSASNTTFYVYSGGVWNTCISPVGAVWHSTSTSWDGTYYFVSSAGSTLVLRSTDGLTWAQAPAALPAASSCLLALPNGVAIAFPSTAGTAYYKSTDHGATWSTFSHGLASGSYFGWAAGSYFVVGIATSAILYASQSGDPNTFTTTINLTNSFSTTVYPKYLGQDIWVSVYSAAGTFAWTRKYSVGYAAATDIPRMNVTGSISVKSIVGSSTAILSLDSTNNTVYKSTNNGVNWSPVSLGTWAGTPSTLGYLKTPDMFIITGATGADTYLTSVDNGTTWTERTFPIASATSITQSDDSNRKNFTLRLIANNLANFLSTQDGINWNAYVASALNTTRISRQGRTKVFSWSTPNISAAAMSTFNVHEVNPAPSYALTGGVNATLISITPTTSIDASLTSNFGIRDFASNESITVAVAGEAQNIAKPTLTNLFYSLNGIVWQKGTINGGSTITMLWESVFWTGKYFVAIPNYYSTNNTVTPFPGFQVGISYDGIDWTIVELGSKLNLQPGELPGLMRAFVTESDVFLTIDGIAAAWRVSSTNVNYIERVSSSIPGTKYVVKAK